MRQLPDRLACVAQRSDLQAAEGIGAAIVLSAILWTVALLLLH